MVMLGEYGHAIGGPCIPAEMQAQIDTMSDAERDAMSRAMPEGSPRIRPQAATQLLGPAGVRSLGHPNIFPNLWITLGGLQMCLRLPRGPDHTELWWFTIVPKGAPPEFRRRVVRQANHVFGPAGLLEQDDGENWSQSTRASHGVTSRSLGHQISMGLGLDEAKPAGAGDGSYVEGVIGEHGQRWLYRAWTEWMAARDWAELEATRSAPPLGTV
jgi:hypothetical protein